MGFLKFESKRHSPKGNMIRLGKNYLYLYREARELIISDTIDVHYDTESGLIKITPNGDRKITTQKKYAKVSVCGLEKIMPIGIYGIKMLSEQELIYKLQTP